MIPFVQQPVFEVFGRNIYLFGILVFTAMMVGLSVARRRCRDTGLDLDIGEDVMLSAIFVGFPVSHVFDVLLYSPEVLREDPLELLRFWGALSSYGGMMGGLVGIFVALHVGGAKALTRRQRMLYVDAIAYGFTFAWVFGRLGCTFALDHPGSITDFPLATSLETPEAQAFIRRIYDDAGNVDLVPPATELARLGFHNLGLYEMLYTLVVMVPTFVLLGRRKRAPGFFLVLFLLVYSPVRFALDFLRESDATYGGLTPAQYVAVAATLASIALLMRVRSGETE